MKKQLLLHIGYPKTGTTTLQEDVFLPLHKEGKINYLGRTTSSSHTRTGRSKFSNTDWAVQLRRHLVLDEALSIKEEELSSTKLNVISDEDMSLHSLYNNSQFGVDKDPCKFAAIIKRILPENVEWTILLTVRRQADLIYSGFKQKYRFVYLRHDKMSFNEFILDSQGNVAQDQLLIFDFNFWSKHYEENLGGKVKFLVFEDLKANLKVFCQDLAEVLPVDSDDLFKLIHGKHRRQKLSDSSITNIEVK